MPETVDLLHSALKFMESDPAYQALISNESVCEQQKIARYEELNPKVMAIIYSIIFIFSTVGNSLVIFVMCFRARTRSVTSMLITNLAISDLMLSFTSLWITPLYYYLQSWPFGSFMCHLFPLCQSASVFNSSMTLLAISVDRYYSVCRHEKSLRKIFTLTPKSCTLLILFIWALSISLSTPYAINMNVEQRACGLKCIEKWDKNIKIDHEVRILYGFGVMILQFAVPLTFIGYSYLKIYLYLRRQCQQSNFCLKVVSTKKRTLFRMLLVMCLSFVVCWLPLNFINVMRDLHLAKFIKPVTRWFTISHAIAMSATMINPLIYAFMSFRDEFSRVTPEFHVFGKFCHNILFCRKRPDADKAPKDQQIGRPLLDLNRMERVSLKDQKNGKAEIRVSNGSKADRPRSIPMIDQISTKETTPNQNSPIDC
ncbi:G-PROTEIN-RECEP-F1-2 domain-containing protein [Aphelenchoides bicaudatus]|nr:G-PROTEIN-RECEP-F1-2 domain-containing protein [Aphelenchoides bicaudatus]